MEIFCLYLNKSTKATDSISFITIKYLQYNKTTPYAVET